QDLARPLAGNNVVMLEIPDGEADKLFREFRVAEFTGIFAGHFLDVKCLDPLIEVQCEKNLDAAVPAFLVDSMDITDFLLALVDYINRIRLVDHLVQAVELVLQSCLDLRQKVLAAHLLNLERDSCISRRSREEPFHIAVGFVEVAADRAPCRAGTQTHDKKKCRDRHEEKYLVMSHGTLLKHRIYGCPGR